jgi:hypothetical protein
MFNQNFCYIPYLKSSLAISELYAVFKHLVAEWTTSRHGRCGRFGSLIYPKDIHPFALFEVHPEMSPARSTAEALFPGAFHLHNLKTSNRFEGLAWSLIFVIVPTEVTGIVKSYLFGPFAQPEFFLGNQFLEKLGVMNNLRTAVRAKAEFRVLILDRVEAVRTIRHDIATFD